MKPRIKARKWKPAAVQAVNNFCNAVAELENLSGVERRHARDIIERLIVLDGNLGARHLPQIPDLDEFGGTGPSLSVPMSLAEQLSLAMAPRGPVDAAEAGAPLNEAQTLAKWRKLVTEGKAG